MLKVEAANQINEFPVCPITGASQPPVNKGDVFYVLNKDEVQQVQKLAKILAQTDKRPDLLAHLKHMIVMEETSNKRSDFNVMLKTDYENLK